MSIRIMFMQTMKLFFGYFIMTNEIKKVNYEIT
jgi:hypothetical protein